MIDIEAYRKICQAATEGPWVVTTNELGGVSIESMSAKGSDPEVARLGRAVGFVSADAAFIAHARAALPEALDEIEQLRIKLAGAEIRINLLRDTLKVIGGQQ